MAQCPNCKGSTPNRGSHVKRSNKKYICKSPSGYSGNSATADFSAVDFGSDGFGYASDSGGYDSGSSYGSSGSSYGSSDSGSSGSSYGSSSGGGWGE